MRSGDDMLRQARGSQGQQIANVTHRQSLGGISSPLKGRETCPGLKTANDAASPPASRTITITFHRKS